MTQSLTIRANTAIEQAFNGKFISKMNKKDYVEGLSKIFDVVSIKIGAEPLTDALQAVIIKFVVDKFPKINIAEVPLAFDLALARKIDCDSVLYGKQLNCEYIGRILTAYKEYRTAKIRELENKKLSEVKIDPDRGRKNEEARQTYLAEIQDMIAKKDHSKLALYHYKYIHLYQHEFSLEEARIALNEVLEQTKKEIELEYMNMNRAEQRRMFREHKRKLANVSEQPEAIKNARIKMAKNWIISQYK